MAGMKAETNQRNKNYIFMAAAEHPINVELELLKFLQQFPNNATSWSQATDEVRDICRAVRQTYNTVDLCLTADSPNGLQALNFYSFKQPSEWNTEGKKFIFGTLRKMSNKSKGVLMNQLKELLYGEE